MINTGSKKISLIILSLGIILSFLIRLFIIINGLNVADIKLLYGMGEAVLKGINPFITLDYNIYPPLGIYIEAGTLYLSQHFNIPFHLLTKVWPNLADIIITVLIYRILIILRVKPITASLWSLFIVLNPILIIISSAHGQIDSISTLLVILAIYLISYYPKKNSDHSQKLYYMGALTLGIAAAIKPSPLMLLPIFLFYTNKNFLERILFLLLTLTPLTITFVYFVSLDPSQIIKIIGTLLTYSGVYDFGYAAILRGVFYQDNANFWLPLSKEILETSKFTFLAGILLITTLFYQTKNLARACLSVYLLFIGVYFGISAQYLSWVLPFAIIIRAKMVVIFSLSGLVALIGFYMFFGPEILLGKLSSGLAFQSKYMSLYVFGNMLLWITTILWLIKIIYDHTSVVKNMGILHKKLIFFSLILFLISIFPTLVLITDIFR